MVNLDIIFVLYVPIDDPITCERSVAQIHGVERVVTCSHPHKTFIGVICFVTLQSSNRPTDRTVNRQ